jgi:hypothetical protein
MRKCNLLGWILAISVSGVLNAQGTSPPAPGNPPPGSEYQLVRLPVVEPLDPPEYENFAVDDAAVASYRCALTRWWNYRAKPHLQYTHWGYPEFFEEMPLGSSVRAHQCEQIAQGLADRLVLYRYDFHEGSTVLNSQGQRRLSDLAVAFPHWSHLRLVIESTPENPELAIARRNHVVKLLQDRNVPAQVEVGLPHGLGPSGDEVLLMNRNLLRQRRYGQYRPGQHRSAVSRLTVVLVARGSPRPESNLHIS